MTIIKEENLTNFNFWSGAVANAQMLTFEELDQVEIALEEVKENYTETEINALFWFKFEYICEMIGLEYDVDNEKIIR